MPIRQVVVIVFFLTGIVGMTFAQGSSDAKPSGIYSNVGLFGSWDGWGGVNLDQKSGSYKDTYGGGRGWINYKLVEKGVYEGTWGEPGRTGTLKLRLSEDGRTAHVDWKVDVSSTLGPINSGSDVWTRAKPPTDDFRSAPSNK